ncbi:MAG: rod shape-determining protein RodA [Caldilineales bacterium]|nr:rod shape-determining protein RodA [Caldilineales bacterium]
MRLNLRRFDFALLLAVLVLAIFGVAMVYSATQRVPGYEAYPTRQAIYVLIGLLLLVLAAAFDYRLLTSLQWPLYVVMVAALVAVMVLGQVRGGAAGWFNAGVVFVQPAELAKVLFVVAFAQYLSSRRERLNRPLTVLGAGLLVAVPMVLIYMQPDLGTAVVLGAIGAVMLFVAGLSWGYIGASALAVVLAAPVIWANLQGYMRERILIFLDPNSNPDASFNVAQALISIGNGGWLGKGFGQGSQSQLHFLRVRYADFIYSVVAEELGFVGAVALMLLILAVLWRLFNIADQARDHFGRLVVTGVIAMILVQSVVSIGMNLGLLPVTGITLPFISFGGSSLVTVMIGIGLAESVAMRNRKIEFD